MLPILVALSAGISAVPAGSPSPPPNPAAAVSTTASGLRWQMIVAGTGAPPTEADSVIVSYEGRLADGSVFDRSSEPAILPVSALVPGFSEALLLMRKGGRYRIWIPPHLAYGAEGAGGVIPPNAEIQFTIDLHDVVPSAQPQ
jgi:FKBP-type peptidyl-prolyl cis-trans isomerase FkpA